MTMGRVWDGLLPSQPQQPIPTLPHLFNTILILVPFKKLNGTRQGGASMINSHTCHALPCLIFKFFFLKIT